MTDRTPLPAGARVLVAGASGHLGRHVVRAFRDRGYRVRALSRRDVTAAALGADELARGDLLRPDTLPAACAGVDLVFSCAGASLDMRAVGDRRTYAEVDERGNRALLDAARGAGVARMAYVSLAGGPAMRHVEYARAHEAFADALAASGLAHTVVRPTGFFWFFGEILEMARSGRGLVIGPGDARTNPIHEAELAEACVDAAAAARPAQEVGGPEVLTREEIVCLAFAALGRPSAKLTHVSPRLFGAVASVARPFHARLAALLEFGAAVSVADVVAPSYGKRRIGDYFRELAARGVGGR
jgi:uncharacterized protein YbjT (DUF2867 family)